MQQRQRAQAAKSYSRTDDHALSATAQGSETLVQPRVVRRLARYSERMRLEEDKLDALRRWGQGLRQAGSEEYAAAGRAILMLIEEIERLRLELLRAREQLSRLGPVPDDEAAEDLGEPVASTLHERLQRVVTRDSDSSPGTRSDLVEEAGSGIESEKTLASPQVLDRRLTATEVTRTYTSPIKLALSCPGDIPELAQATVILLGLRY